MFGRDFPFRSTNLCVHKLPSLFRSALCDLPAIFLTAFGLPSTTCEGCAYIIPPDWDTYDSLLLPALWNELRMGLGCWPSWFTCWMLLLDGCVGCVCDRDRRIAFGLAGVCFRSVRALMASATFTPLIGDLTLGEGSKRKAGGGGRFSTDPTGVRGLFVLVIDDVLRIGGGGLFCIEPRRSKAFLIVPQEYTAGKCPGDKQKHKYFQEI